MYYIIIHVQVVFHSNSSYSTLYVLNIIPVFPGEFSIL